MPAKRLRQCQTADGPRPARRSLRAVPRTARQPPKRTRPPERPALKPAARHPPAGRPRCPPGRGLRRPGRRGNRASVGRWGARAEPAAAPVAQGGGAAQSRGGLRCGGGSDCDALGDTSDRESMLGRGEVGVAFGGAGRALGIAARRSPPHWRPRPRSRGAPARPPAAPIPGRSGRPGTRSTGSTPPGARRHEARAASPRSSDGGGRGSWSGRLDRRRTPRTDRLGHHPRWAALAQSSPR